MEYRVGLGHDTHRLVSGRRLLLGGVEIPFDRGLEGHSDADVLLHALTDALLGAAGLGDIGDAFPDTDPRWHGADSRRFVEAAWQRVKNAGWQLVNVDAVVFAEQPRLGPWKERIRQNISDLLNIPIANVNIKAKTGEKVGHIGRGEALAAQVIVLLVRAGDRAAAGGTGSFGAVAPAD
ncbi:MAG: 2-C-methyl-D-erythritol 2,4-cyclodiphosphate synthase [Gemmataceae bacterium]|nr:2-C-methyl-D-erythritol 2,4-cyclodiphosphate synthase [Gemmataceae bacterium]MCS7270617.1 2-C-methyl-D-erythritol 2,4-cyclodiphosphate synthase [Gemmataceae bacterium]MDW8242811.1 2-C-methyl-D-erythritol 2,4-cyclodiphosphate synthase [Thermogemmata sp.]